MSESYSWPDAQENAGWVYPFPPSSGNYLYWNGHNLRLKGVWVGMTGDGDEPATLQCHDGDSHHAAPGWWLPVEKAEPKNLKMPDPRRTKG